MTLPKELIEDYKSNAKIKDLCRKYELPHHIVKNQLIKMGLSDEPAWGGRREGCGRKRKERSNELERIREKNKKIGHSHRQPEGTKANPRSNLCRKYSNDCYMG